MAGPPAVEEGVTRVPPRWQIITKKIFKFILHQWLLIGMGVACALAYCFPNVAKHGGIIRSQYSVMYGVIAIIFLISGLSIDRRKLFLQFMNWRLHLTVQVISFLFIPAVVLVVVYAILAGDPTGKINRSVLAGYIFVACIPTTIASNVVMTRSAGGDDAAALVEVLIANVFAPFVTAAWTVALIPKTPEFDAWRYGGGDMSSMYRNVFQQLGLSVLLPLFVGQLVRWTWPDLVARVLQKTKLPKLASVCMLLLIWTTFSSCFATGALQEMDTQSIIFVVLFNIALYIFLTGICFIVSRPPQIFASNRWYKAVFQPLPPKETIAACFCGPAKSTALGIPLLYAMWSPLDLYLKAQTSVPVLLYTTEQICVAHFFVQIFRKWHSYIEKRDGEQIARGDSPETDMVETPVDGRHLPLRVENDSKA
ncbi:hypothetical protein N7466_010578 [Penicillium verhagenii]|uniref:uncharacterized protein n=1 Tax=Penicillium verhagenii TaxID=1562060 RepID=UPI0025453C58|nr:uncharacterized protein N7466_010578 [Penicillium verhagenii]KAJ5918586.1 hypothetical protein N7466_010578 [Penicillium verhagenii]